MKTVTVVFKVDETRIDSGMGIKDLFASSMELAFAMGQDIIKIESFRVSDGPEANKSGESSPPTYLSDETAVILLEGLRLVSRDDPAMSNNYRLELSYTGGKEYTIDYKGVVVRDKMYNSLKEELSKISR